MAFAPDAFVDEVLRRPKEACTPYTLTQRAALTGALERIRRDGYATESEESQIGWCGFGVPIFSISGTCVGALSVEAPQALRNPATSAKTIALLRGAAQTIGAELT